LDTFLFNLLVGVGKENNYFFKEKTGSRKLLTILIMPLNWIQTHHITKTPNFMSVMEEFKPD